MQTNVFPQTHFGAIPVLFLLIVPYLISLLSFRRAVSLSMGASIGAATLAIMASAFIIGGRITALTRSPVRPPDWIEFGRVIFGVFLPTLPAFVLMLIQKWRGIGLTEGEKRPGGDGLQAWLTPWRLCWSAALAAGIWLWFDVPLVLLFCLFVASLAAYPLIAWSTSAELVAMAPPLPPAAVVDAIAPEREKVLNMVADNRITAEEGAELLNALAATRPPIASVPTSASPMTAARKLVVAGAALVVAGFFLPWLTVDPGKELGRLANQMTTQFQGMPAGMELPIPKTGEIHVTGGQIGSGLGWLVLLLAGAVAALPLTSGALNSRTERLLETIGLAVTGFILLYVLSSSIRYVAIGLVIVLAGYLCEVFGVVRQRRSSIVGSQSS
jgi:hypothetical protein